MYIMRSTPLTCCSIGAATASATSLALAPGELQVTATVGGCSCVNAATGRVARSGSFARRPLRSSGFVTRGIPPRQASLALRAGSRLLGRLFRGLGVDLGALADALQAADDDALVGLDPLLDDAQPVVDAA